MNILIIEDEIIAAERMQELVGKTIENARIIGMCDSIEGSVKFLRYNGMPDLILMDIELVDGQSFEIFREIDVTCPVIFTTAYDEFALRAFKVNSIDYLLKPIQEEELKQSITKFRQLKELFETKNSLHLDELLVALRRTTVPLSESHRERFLVRKGKQLISISVEEVSFFYSEGHCTFLKTFAGLPFSLDNSLDEVEEQVDPARFFRASRKYLLERRSIRSVKSDTNGKFRVIVKPEIKEEVMVSRDRAPEFRKWLGG